MRPLKNELKLQLQEMWCLPPKASADFVCCMEDVLKVYHRPYDPERPVAGMDETSKQLMGEVREPLPTIPGQVERYDAAAAVAGQRHRVAGTQVCGWCREGHGC